ncbi:bifunctional DNA recombination and repair protein Rad51-like [Babesia duncani]|uniref:Bifunctional DNA recombination and repair protein Rad51-like n=1 Tax=Babesia duncani TaxID=323732 RepID=A0AAD9UQS4_9APIC|nr:bifunctional DNA recombination and repair protein Rad51-like [Babesia duncani]
MNNVAMHIYNTQKCFQEEPMTLAFGIDAIDSMLDGGLQTGKLFEIYGPSSSGKTQFSLTLVAEVLIKYHTRPKCAIIYMSTMGTFPVERLYEIIESKLGDCEIQIDIKELLQNVSIYTIRDVEDLNKKLISAFKQSMHIKTVFQPFIDHFQRITILLNNVANVGRILKRLAFEFQTCVLVTNELKPAMGDAWSSCLNGRFLIQLQRKMAVLMRMSIGTGITNKRFFQIIQNHNTPPSQPISFTITKRGIETI